MFDGLIFDLDGTLWNATDIICKTWNIILNEYSEVEREPITIEELEGCMGLQLDEIGKRLFKSADSSLRKELMDKCCKLECEYLAKEGGSLFPELKEILKYLKKKYKLYIVSNCQYGYIESFFEGHNTGEYFDDYLCAEETGLSKGQNIKIIAERNGLKNPIYIGDTQGDKDAADEAEIPFVFAAYGFGQVDGFDYKVESFKELRDIF